MGALISFTGIGIVALHLDKNISFLGFICMLAAAATWGLGNLITKKNNKISMIALVVWGSFVACMPMLLFALIFEGPQALTDTLSQLTWHGTLSLFYIVYISTWIGYGLWNKLLSLYPVGTIVPFTLLVPVFGILSSAIVLGEPIQTWKLGAGLLVISGLCINLFGARLLALMQRSLIKV
jgi:O-acetylserine/cysteine efflux transporter